MTQLQEPDSPTQDRGGVDRRTFLGFVIAAPTLVAAVRLAGPAQAAGLLPIDPPGSLPTETKGGGSGIPSAPEPADVYDLSDFLNDSCRPTNGLLTITMQPDGTAHFDLPRSEVGQGITTAFTMLIADELDLPLDKVVVTLADANPNLVYNQLTGGSNTLHSLYTPVRTAAAIAKAHLVAAAAAAWGVPVSSLSTSNGYITGPGGRTASYGSLARAAAATTTTATSVTLKPASQMTYVGTAQRRIDALDAVTGRKKFTLDLNPVPGAVPTMVHRAPTIHGTPKTVINAAEVLKMPGVVGVAKISTGVAVAARTFGQCIDAVRALQVTWNAGPVDGESDDTVLQKLKAGELPLAVPALPAGAQTIEQAFTFYFRSNSPLQTGQAIANVTATTAEVWASLKSPIVTQQTIAKNLGLTQDAVKVHVVTGGGSFGRHLFGDDAIEAAECSRALGRPVKLMWARTDDFRHGRTHPMATCRTRAVVAAGEVLSFEQRHTSVATDFTHGLGEMLTAMGAQMKGVNGIGGNYTFSQSIFQLTTNVPYHYGATSQQLNEIFDFDSFYTSSMRNIYSPDVTTAIELVTDQIAKAVGQDPLAFRRAFVKDDRMVAVLDKLAAVGQWGKQMPAGTAQGLGLHMEYKGCIAALVEIDARPATVSRVVRDAYTGPRVTRVVVVADVGLPINLLGLEAQLQGGAMDGIANALTSSLHIKDGIPLEGSWDNYYYTRQWNVPPAVEVHVMPANAAEPGGAGELAVAPVMAAVATAYARATGTMPTEFPINHNKPLGFTPLPTVPPIPQSPTDGLRAAR